MSADAEKYLSDSQQRLLKLILTLAGHEVEGLAPGQIATAAECAPSAVTRDLANLKHAGFAEQIQTTGRWRLGPQVTQLGLRYMTAMDRAERKLTDVRSRFSAAD